MNDAHTIGEHVRINDHYTWGGGKLAGKVVRITEVHDHRETFDDADALIYAGTLHYADSGMDVTVPIAPEDIDESYDHYEARQRASWNAFLAELFS